jgi:hypothetical protein
MNENMIEDLEQEFNGKIRWRTFSIWYADSDENVRMYGVFVFLIDNVFHFRDYKHVKTILGIEIKDKHPEEYVPFNGSFRLEDVKNICRVTKKKALKCIRSGQKATVSPLIARIFMDTVLLVDTGDKQYFFQFPDKEFRKLFEQKGE